MSPGVAEVEGALDVEMDVERACASAMVASARWMDCCRTVVLDWRVVWRVLSVESSPCSVAMAACRDRDCETRDCAAVSDCAALARRVSARVWDTA